MSYARNLLRKFQRIAKELLKKEHCNIEHLLYFVLTRLICYGATRKGTIGQENKITVYKQNVAR